MATDAHDGIELPYANYQIVLAAADTGIRGSAYYIWVNGTDECPDCEFGPIACIPFSTKEPGYHDRAKARAAELLRRANAYEDLMRSLAWSLNHLSGVAEYWQGMALHRYQEASALLADLNDAADNLASNNAQTLADTKND